MADYPAFQIIDCRVDPEDDAEPHLGPSPSPGAQTWKKEVPDMVRIGSRRFLLEPNDYAEFEALTRGLSLDDAAAFRCLREVVENP